MNRFERTSPCVYCVNESISKETEFSTWKIELGACKLGNSWEERGYFWMPVRSSTRTRGLHGAMTCFDERDDGLVGAIRENGRSGCVGAGGFFAMADAVNGGDQKAAGRAAEHVDIAGGAFTGKREIGNAVFDKGMV